MNLIKSIKELITEASKKKVLMDKLGFNENQAEMLDSLCGPLSVWMGNKLLKFFQEYHGGMTQELNPEELKKASINLVNQNNLVRRQREQIVSIMDYIRVGLDGNTSTVKDLPYVELYNESNQWHQSLGTKDGDINYKEEHPIVVDFRNEDGIGFYWVDTETNDCPEESKRMGHCGRTDRNNSVYSLREFKKLNDKYTINKSHLTASIGDRDGILYQLKGPHNSKPKEEYHNYILPLFYVLGGDGEQSGYLIQGFGSEYNSREDFKLTDLPEEVIKSLYSNRPELFKSRSLQKKLIELGLIEKPEIDYNITVDIDPGRLSNYIDGDYKVGSYKKKTPAGNDYSVDVYMFDKIMGGDTWEFCGSDSDDWSGALRYYVDSKNEQRIEEMIKEMASSHNPDFDEDEFNELSLDEKIEEFDEDYDIRNALNRAYDDAYCSEYTDYLYDTLRGAVEDYGKIIRFDDERVIFEVNIESYIDELDDDMFDEYLENCDDDLSCVFEEMVGQGDVDKPKCDFDDRWTPDIDYGNYNEVLRDLLSEI